jgi:hypothetical protein
MSGVKDGWPAPPPETLGWRPISASIARFAAAGSPPSAMLILTTLSPLTCVIEATHFAGAPFTRATVEESHGGRRCDVESSSPWP